MITRKQILRSVKHVVDTSNLVSINNDAIDSYVKNFKEIKRKHWSEIYPLGYKRKKSDEDELDFLFLIGSQAFCFWGYPKKWILKYKGKNLDGWWALIAVFERALENNLPILDGSYLAKLSLQEVKQIFVGNPEIPLVKERWRILKHIGKTLTKKYHGRFHNFYRKMKRDAFALLELMVKEFAGFDDVVAYKKRKIFFYKKAQVVLTDINEMFKGKDYGAIKNVDKLPGHADYKIPAILRKYGILVYNRQLANKIDGRTKIRAGSNAEVEIRANMLWATHLICQRLTLRFPEINPSVLNGVLWGQSQKKHRGDKPYHLTKTIYY